MKIAISSKGNSIGADIDPRFGRAAYFIIYDLNTDSWEVIDNSENVNRIGGAGVQTATNLIDRDVDYVLTGHCGPNAFRTLKAGNVKVISGIEGQVKEIIEKFKKGDLKESSQPDVEGHWK